MACTAPLSAVEIRTRPPRSSSSSIADYIAEVAHFRGAIGQLVMDEFRLGEVAFGKRLCDFLQMGANGLDASCVLAIESTNFNRPAVAHRPECVLRRLMGKAHRRVATLIDAVRAMLGTRHLGQEKQCEDHQ